jgi:hypothetical protein
MKQLYIVIFLSALTIALGQNKGHEKMGKGKEKMNKMMKNDNMGHNKKEKMFENKSFFKHTNKIILEAKKVVKQNKKYTGNLSKAIAHQKFALKLLKKEKKSQQALQHSSLARSYAKKAIEANKGILNKDLETSSEEIIEIGTMPSPEEMDKTLIKAEPKGFNATDEASVAMANLEKELDE